MGRRAGRPSSAPGLGAPAYYQSVVRCPFRSHTVLSQATTGCVCYFRKWHVNTVPGSHASCEVEHDWRSLRSGEKASRVWCRTLRERSLIQRTLKIDSKDVIANDMRCSQPSRVWCDSLLGSPCPFPILRNRMGQTDQAADAKLPVDHSSVTQDTHWDAPSVGRSRDPKPCPMRRKGR